VQGWGVGKTMFGKGGEMECSRGASVFLKTGGCGKGRVRSRRNTRDRVWKGGRYVRRGKRFHLGREGLLYLKPLEKGIFQYGRGEGKSKWERA